MAVSTSLPRGWSTDDFAFVVDRLFPEFDDAPIDTIAFSIRDAAREILPAAGRTELVARCREIIRDKLRLSEVPGSQPDRA
jgi:hypothetical protein